MKRIQNSLSSFSLPAPLENCCNDTFDGETRWFDQKTTPAGDNVDVMAYFFHNKFGARTKESEDILKLLEQLSTVEEKVKILEEQLGVSREQHINILPVKRHDDNHPRTTGQKDMKQRTRDLRCKCFPWSWKQELRESHQKKQPVLVNDIEKIMYYKKKNSKDSNTADNSKRASKVSWDEDITVRYIGDQDKGELLQKKIRKKQLKNNLSDPTVNETFTDDDKDIVHVKIRIPKRGKQVGSNNVFEILGKNIVGDAAINNEISDSKKSSIDSDNTGDTHARHTDTAVKDSEVQASVSRTTTTYLNNSKDSAVDSVPLYSQELKSSESNINENTRIKVVKETETQTEPEFKPEYIDEPVLPRSVTVLSYESDKVRVDPIAMLEVPGMPGDHRVVGIPLKEPGKSTCGSESCACKGSKKNDQNLAKLKKSISLSDSESLELKSAIEMKSEPDKMNVLTDVGMVNVVSHSMRCLCAVCETFGSQGGPPRKSSIRSDTGAVVSKKVVRVAHNSAFRNILTHTEECGCDICLAIEDETFRNKARRSTRISTKDSVLLVENKGICGCQNCKTVTVNPTQDLEAMLSIVNSGKIDTCYYSDATIPSISSFPWSYQRHNQVNSTSPSIDSSESNYRLNTQRLDKHMNQSGSAHDQKAQSKNVTMIKHHEETNKSLMIISAKHLESNKMRRYRSIEGRLQDASPSAESVHEHYQCPNCNAKIWTNGDRHPSNYETHPHHINSEHTVEEIHLESTGNADRNENRIDHGNKESFNRKLRSKISAKKEKIVELSKRLTKKTSIKNFQCNTSRDHEVQWHKSLEEIIRDLITGKTINKGAKSYSYTVKLGRIHDKPSTKVRIIDCSNPEEDSCTSTASIDSLNPPVTSRHQSPASPEVYFLKPLSNISFSLTHSSNFAKSGDSFITTSNSNDFPNNYQFTTPACYGSTVVVSPRPSLILLSSTTDSEQLPQRINGPRDLWTTFRPESGIFRPIKKKRTKKGKFIIKFNGKLRDFFNKYGQKQVKPISNEGEMAEFRTE